MDDEFNELENMLLLSQSNDNNDLQTLTAFLGEIMNDIDCIRMFKLIIVHSCESVAISQAMVQMKRAIDIYKDNMSMKFKMECIQVLIDVILDSNYVTKDKWTAIGCVNDLLTDKTAVSKEIIAFIQTENSEIILFQLCLLSRHAKSIISKHSNNSGLMGTIYGLSIKGLQSDSVVSINNSITVISKMLDICSDHLIEIYSLIVSRFDFILRETCDNQTKFFNCLQDLISPNIDCNLIVDSLMHILSDMPIVSSTKIAIINSFQGIISEFNSDQMMTIISIIVHSIHEYIEEFQEVPNSATDFVKQMFLTIDPEMAWEYIMHSIPKIEVDNTESQIVTALIFVLEVFLVNPEFISNDQDYVFAIFDASFASNSVLVLENACDVLHKFFANSLLHGKATIYIPLLLTLIVSENSDVSFKAYEALSGALVYPECHPKNLLITLLSLCSKQNSQTIHSYFECMYLALKYSKCVDKQCCETVYSMILPFLESYSDTQLTGMSLQLLLEIFKNDEKFCPNIFDFTTGPLEFCLQHSNLDGVTKGLMFLSEISKIFKEESLPFISKFIHILDELLDPKSYKFATFRNVLVYICIIISETHSHELYDVVYPIEIKYLNSKIMYRIKMALHHLRIIIHMASFDQYEEILNRIVAIMNTEDYDDDLLSDSLHTLDKMAKHVPQDHQSEFFDIYVTIIESFVKGEFLILNGRSFLAEETHFNIDLLNDFSDFVGSVFRLSTTDVDDIVRLFMVLLNHSKEAYRVVAVSIVIDALDNSSLSHEFLQMFMDQIGLFINTSQSEGSRQNAVYLLNIVLRKFPDAITQISSIYDTIKRWFEESTTNDSNSYLISNVCSLFSQCAIYDYSRFEELLSISLKDFPPADKSEVAPMCSNFVSIVGSKMLSETLKKKISYGFALILTDPPSSFENYKISEELLIDIQTCLFSMASSSPDTYAYVIEKIKMLPGRENRLLSVMQ